MSTALDQKIKEFQELILGWYSNHGRSFPWRRKGLSKYQYIIAETLLQRTKAESVAKFYPDFIIQYPSWKSLAKADINVVAEYLKPVGLYKQRSVRLVNLAKEMVKRNGRIPSKRKDLEALPFVGQYIANAIELVIFNQPSPLIDVNMARVLERVFGPRKLSDIRHDPYLQELCAHVVNHERSRDLNWAILDLSALVCRPKPICIRCPLSKICKTFKQISQRIL